MDQCKDVCALLYILHEKQYKCCMASDKTTTGIPEDVMHCMSSTSHKSLSIKVSIIINMYCS